MKAIHVLTLALILSLLLAGLALANSGLERPREVLSGGASDSTAGAVSMRATLMRSRSMARDSEPISSFFLIITG